MRYYDLKGKHLRMEKVPEPSALKLKELFDSDGDNIEMTHVVTISDRPLYRLPTFKEIEEGTDPKEYILTTPNDGII